MTIDAMIEVYLLKKETNLEIDFAHNLYCATKLVKPDFMFQVGENKYIVEIDRMNERGVALNKKFEDYNDYFMYTNTDQIKGIYFIDPSVMNAYLKQQVPLKIGVLEGRIYVLY